MALQVISDLLKPERHNLTIKEDKKRGVFVDGLSEWVVRSPQEVSISVSGTSVQGFPYAIPSSSAAACGHALLMFCNCGSAGGGHELR